MAVWGAPVAREDDAERAVRAALELVDAVRALGPTIQARAGVLTGTYAAHPERFVKGPPRVEPVPAEVWINRPVKEVPQPNLRTLVSHRWLASAL